MQTLCPAQPAYGHMGMLPLAPCNLWNPLQWSASNLFETMRQTIEGESIGRDTQPLPAEVRSWHSRRSMGRGNHSPSAGGLSAGLDCPFCKLPGVPSCQFVSNQAGPAERLCDPTLWQVKALYVPCAGRGNKPTQMLVPFIRHLKYLAVAEVRLHTKLCRAAARQLPADWAAQVSVPRSLTRVWMCALWGDML